MENNERPARPVNENGPGGREGEHGFIRTGHDFRRARRREGTASAVLKAMVFQRGFGL